MMTKRDWIAFVIPPEGAIATMRMTKSPSIEVLQELVGGDVQIIPHFTTFEHEGKFYKRGVAFCHEEGKLIGLPDNPKAYNFWRVACPIGDPRRMKLNGNVVFVAKEPINDYKG